MKKEHTSLFSNLWGAKGKSESEKSTPVIITSYSQPHVLQQRMKEEKLTHGQTVTANLSPVRLESNFGKMVMYFCPMQTIEVLNELTPGDGGSIPPEAKLIDFEVPSGTKPGLYTVEKATLFSNGTMQVIANENTKFIPINETNHPYTDEMQRRILERDRREYLTRITQQPIYTPSIEVQAYFGSIYIR